MGLTPQFSAATFAADISRFAVNEEDKLIKAFAFIGETYINEARSVQTYKDKTGNLRSSIGYSIVKDGRIVSLKSTSSDGKDFAKSLVSDGPKKGIYLIVFAGMEYALHVEAKGFDVITGSQPSKAEIIATFKDLLG